jgi:hypothetical protein
MYLLAKNMAPEPCEKRAFAAAMYELASELIPSTYTKGDTSRILESARLASSFLLLR